MSKDVFDSIRIDRRSATPIHEQIKNELQTLIASRKLTHEGGLPTIEEFAQHLEVPAQQVKNAFQTLTELNFITPDDTGKYHIIFFDLHSDLGKPFYNIIDQIIAMGLKVSIQLVERRIFTPSKADSILYGFSTNERILMVKRLYLGNQRVFFEIEHYIPLSIFPRFEHELTGNERIYPLMADHAQVQMKQATRLAEAKEMSPSMAHLFSLKPGSTYLEVSSRMYDQYNRQIEYSVTNLVANYSIELTLSRSDLFST